MKKAFAFAMTMLLGASLALAQDTGGDKNKLNPQPLPPGKSAPKPEATTKGKKVKSGKKNKTEVGRISGCRLACRIVRTTNAPTL